jgi:lipopolysaccharide/colanic/teichoic acid biosynthesis glycosyltransferase
MMAEPIIPDDRTAILVADLRHDHEDEWERMLATASVRGHLVYHVKQLRESLTGRISIEHLSESSFGSLLPSLAYVRFKRVFDIVICLALAPVVVSIGLVIAAAIKLDSSGPVFFVQRRVGYRGHEFSMVKFRTMVPRAAMADDDAAREDAMTKSADNRITRVGWFLRRSRLDELPQLLNVLRGEMGVIGPRPEATALSRWYEAEIPFYVYRHVVRPGITGWAQVRQGHVTNLQDVNEKLHYDFFYIKNLSYWLDILIVLMTVPTMVTGSGSK